MTKERTYLAFDYGEHKIGIAVGQSVTCTALDLDTVKWDSSPDWKRIDRHIEEWQPCALVIGLPLDSAGQETTMSARARRFGRMLSDRHRLPVHWVNEYLTSAAAARSASALGSRDRRNRDQVAARIILETFLNTGLR